MTDDQIRAWLEKTRGYRKHIPVTSEEHFALLDCLTELLQYRELHRSIKWAVWVRDQSAESGWKCCGWFQYADSANEYRELVEYRADLERWPDPMLLVLPANEVPCLTAR